MGETQPTYNEGDIMGVPYAASIPVAQLDTDSRAAFVVRTYGHLFAAIVLFTLLEVMYFMTGLAVPITKAVSGMNWLIILGIFMVSSMGASALAHNSRSLPLQYAGLVLSVFVWSIIFVPLLWVANTYFEGVITSAALVTLLGFGGLTAIAFITRKDFSFLRGVLMWCGIAALLLIVAGVLFGFTLGPIFMVAMIAYSGAAILYKTSEVLHHFPEDRYVGAALELFAAVALMLWYVIQFFMSLNRN